MHAQVLSSFHSYHDAVHSVFSVSSAPHTITGRLIRTFDSRLSEQPTDLKKVADKQETWGVAAGFPGCFLWTFLEYVS